MKSSRELREIFLAYFERNGHRRVASHSLIPPADPTLLFVNAGMVQFKDVFVGARKVDYRRATSSQKCLRVSGKHNDLENVGRTARHHTFFEMLGNFSFGDYFKPDAIRFGYELLVKVLGLDATRMYYTVFGGDQTEGIPPDDEAKQLWMQTAQVGPERILAFGKKDNFWAMGETGPCGPCSEILYDRGPGPWACGRPECGPGCDCDRYTEIWNLVFMQFERKVAGGELVPLPAPSIDTGMGLERLAALVQGKATNYDTDLFMPLIVRTVELYGKEKGSPAVFGRDEETDVALRVIADHARAAAFLVADGVYPDNEGRGYITRLLCRRAIRFGRKMGFERPFFAEVCDHVRSFMGDAYPQLHDKAQLVRQVIGVEEESFSKTFDDGRVALEKEVERLREEGETRVRGRFLFWLHDERGFQPDLVEAIVKERGMGIDRAGYDALMEEKRQASGKADAGDDRGEAVRQQIAADLKSPTAFAGYETETAVSGSLAILKDGRPADQIRSGETGELVLSQTPFYAESGGQSGDTGELSGSDGFRARVTDTRKVADVWFHAVKVEQGAHRLGGALDARVDGKRRAGIRAHHSATHLLHWALSTVLGEHVKQEGSLVREDLLRFDFRHFAPLTREEIERIETLVAEQVVRNTEVKTEVLPVEQALGTGAKAFFGEKYGSVVRLVTMGDGDSRELCGGTHARRTGDIGMLRIVKQEAVSSGVRRVYAVCHLAAVGAVHERERWLNDSAALLRTPPEELEPRVRKLLDRDLALEKEVAQLNRKVVMAAQGAAEAPYEISDLRGCTKLAVGYLPDGGMDQVRSLADLLRDKIGDGVVLVGGAAGGKLVFVVAATRSLSSVHAGRIVSQLAPLSGSRGGGKPDFGQAGGGDPAAWDKIKERFEALVLDAFAGK